MLLSMITDPTSSGIPFIGQLVHFYPDSHTRLAAFVVETSPPERDESQNYKRPNCDLFIPSLLQVCKSPSSSFRTAVLPANIELPDESPEGCWSFPNEIAVLQKTDSEELRGTLSNLHVGSIY